MFNIQNNDESIQLSDVYSSLVGSAADGVGASQKAVYQMLADTLGASSSYRNLRYKYVALDVTSITLDAIKTYLVSDIAFCQQGVGIYHFASTNGQRATVIKSGVTSSGFACIVFSYYDAIPAMHLSYVASSGIWKEKLLVVGGISAPTQTILTTTIPTAQWTAASKIVLPPGIYYIRSRAFFNPNASGFRALNLSLTSDNSEVTISSPAVNGAPTNLVTGSIVGVSSETTYYLNVYQNSGGDLVVNPAIGATRLS